MPRRLTSEQRAFAGRHVAIASAAFGLTAALDPIPAYRLSHDSRLPGLSLGRLWRAPLAAVLASTEGLLLDLRSEAYASLGPLPERPDAVFVRVVSEDDGGPPPRPQPFQQEGQGRVRAPARSRPASTTRMPIRCWPGRRRPASASTGARRANSIS